MVTRKSRLVFILVTGIIALVAFGHACLPPSGGVPAEPIGTASDALVPPDAEEVVNLAKADLAERKGIDKEEIVVVEVVEVDWSDTSLGCPEPGMMYAQVITPGYKILLSYAGETYQYHSDKVGRVVYCGSRSLRVLPVERCRTARM